MEKKPGKHAPKAKNVPQKLQVMFEEGSRKDSPKPSTSKEQVIPSQEHLSEMTIADSVSNSYLFAKNRPHLNLIASPLDSNSSFLYHYCDDNSNSDVHMYDNPEQQALGKLIKNYLVDDNEEDALPNPPAHVFRPSLSKWIEENPNHLYLQPIQKYLSSSDSSLPLNTRILSPLQPVRTENETKLMSPSLKPEIYNSDPFGNDSAEKEQVRQSIKIASQKYESALKTLENVINRLSEPWPGRKKKLK